VLDVRLLARNDERHVVEVDRIRHVVDVVFHGDTAVSRSHGGSVTWLRPPRFADHESDLAGSGPVCPLPGRVIAVHVEPGTRVGDGTVLMVIEAMKMEHTITAHADAVVTEVRFGVGDRVDAGDLLVVLAAPSE
jgi:biotin carboxyl carrier protein